MADVDETKTINELVQEFAKDTFNATQSESNHETTLRLLKILNKYKEHLEYQKGGKIADVSHYGHLTHFSSNLHCLADKDCQLKNHMKSTTEHKTENTAVNNTSSGELPWYKRWWQSLFGKKKETRRLSETDEKAEEISKKTMGALRNFMNIFKFSKSEKKEETSE